MAPELTSVFESLQSALFVTKPITGEHALWLLFGLPNPSPSRSAKYVTKETPSFTSPSQSSSKVLQTSEALGLILALLSLQSVAFKT